MDQAKMFSSEETDTTEAEELGKEGLDGEPLEFSKIEV